MERITEQEQKLIKEAVKNAKSFGLGYISSVKNLFEMYDIKYSSKRHDAHIFNEAI